MSLCITASSRGESEGEGCPLSWAPSAHAVAGNGAPFNTRGAPPAADAVAGNGLSCRFLASTATGMQQHEGGAKYHAVYSHAACRSKSVSSL
jgi:hypothetical protein